MPSVKMDLPKPVRIYVRGEKLHEEHNPTPELVEYPAGKAVHVDADHAEHPHMVAMGAKPSEIGDDETGDDDTGDDETGGDDTDEESDDVESDDSDQSGDDDSESDDSESGGDGDDDGTGGDAGKDQSGDKPPARRSYRRGGRRRSTG